MHTNVGRKTQHEETKTHLCGFFKTHRQSEDSWNSAAKLKGNPYNGNIIGIGADFAKKTQEQRKALLTTTPLHSHGQTFQPIDRLHKWCRIWITIQYKGAYLASWKAWIFVRSQEKIKLITSLGGLPYVYCWWNGYSWRWKKCYVFKAVWPERPWHWLKTWDTL